ncbi:hypothetical protein KCU81_g2874, partial [Aureobasidium melanogenum]|uniref:Uncharacterized protein n=1 Tax=Aureobasidium melanogenum (strain CBS 110374) TaxID=1043003 RepID=A0A074VL58_AURM1
MLRSSIRASKVEEDVEKDKQEGVRDDEGRPRLQGQDGRQSTQHEKVDRRTPLTLQTAWSSLQDPQRPLELDNRSISHQHLQRCISTRAVSSLAKAPSVAVISFFLLSDRLVPQVALNLSIPKPSERECQQHRLARARGSTSSKEMRWPSTTGKESFNQALHLVNLNQPSRQDVIKIINPDSGLNKMLEIANQEFDKFVFVTQIILIFRRLSEQHVVSSPHFEHHLRNASSSEDRPHLLGLVHFVPQRFLS